MTMVEKVEGWRWPEEGTLGVLARCAVARSRCGLRRRTSSPTVSVPPATLAAQHVAGMFRAGAVILQQIAAGTLPQPAFLVSRPFLLVSAPPPACPYPPLVYPTCLAMSPCSQTTTGLLVSRPPPPGGVRTDTYCRMVTDMRSATPP